MRQTKLDLNQSFSEALASKQSQQERIVSGIEEDIEREREAMGSTSTASAALFHHFQLTSINLDSPRKPPYKTVSFSNSWKESGLLRHGVTRRRSQRLDPVVRFSAFGENSGDSPTETTPGVGSALEDRPAVEDVSFEQEDKTSSIYGFLYPDKEELPDDKEMTIFDHLEELRERIFVSVLAVGAAILGCFAYSKDLIVFLEAPVKTQGVRFLQLAPGEFFFTTLKVSGYCGLLLGSPVILYEIIAFPSNRQAQLLPVLKGLVQLTDDEILTDACWALAYLSDNTNEHIQAVIDSGVIPRIIQLLAHMSPAVLIPALRTIGNIVTGNDVQTQTVVDHQVLPSLLVLITKNYKKSIKKEACWTISNITAGSSNQIQAVIEAGVIQALVWVLDNAEFEVKKEAAWGIANATTGSTHDQIKFMVSKGCIRPICDLLTCPDPRIAMVCLEAVENILVVGEAVKRSGLTGDENLFATLVEDAGGLEKIENLQSHYNEDIYQRSVKVLETFWTEDDGEEAGDGNNDIRVNVPPPGLFNFI